MRREYQATLESDDSPVSTAILSMEEEVLLLDEAAACQAEIASELTEAERCIETTDALEDLAVICADINEATPTELRLIENSGTLVVAGTPVLPEEIVPSLESFQGKRIAVESIRDTANTIWVNIQKFVRVIWEKIENFFSNMFQITPGMRLRIKLLRNRLTNNSGQLTKEFITLTSGVRAMTLGGRPVANDVELEKGMASLKEACKYVYGPYVQHLAKRGDAVKHSLSAFASAPAVAPVDELVVVMRNLDRSIPQVPGAGSVDTKRYPGYDTVEGKPMLGNFSLVLKRPSAADMEAASTLAALDRERSAGLSLEMSKQMYPGPRIRVSTWQFRTPSLQAMNDLLNDAEELLTILEEYQNHRARELKTIRKFLETESTKATAAIDSLFKGQQSEAAPSELVSYYRGLLNFNPAFARWVQAPTVSLMSTTLSSLRGIMMLGEKTELAYV